MNIAFAENSELYSLSPIIDSMDILDVNIGSITLKDYITKICNEINCGKAIITIKKGFVPSEELINELNNMRSACIINSDNEIAMWISEDGKIPEDAPRINMSNHCFDLFYPWNLLELNEYIASKLSNNKINGIIRDGVTIDGLISLGEGSIILPGVYIEGKVIIGKNCKIGPNCYIRGNTTIGDNCHIGQAVEVKNSLLMKKVSAGHLSYIGDSVICGDVNFGAGTIISNFRHDGANHHSEIGGKLIDTGRRKFGAIIGSNVYTGVNTSIYCGRKIWPNQMTRPGAIIQKDLKDLC